VADARGWRACGDEIGAGAINERLGALLEEAKVGVQLADSQGKLASEGGSQRAACAEESGVERQDQVAAVEVKGGLGWLKMPSYAKTTGSNGIHVYVPIVRGPLQKQVWTFAKTFAQALAAQRPDLITAEYTIAKRPAGRVLVDYNQNAWGRTLASIYSVRPTPRALVSAPVTWGEIERGIALEDFRLDNLPARIKKLGDLWAALLVRTGRVRLDRFL